MCYLYTFGGFHFVQVSQRQHTIISQEKKNSIRHAFDGENNAIIESENTQEIKYCQLFKISSKVWVFWVSWLT